MSQATFIKPAGRDLTGPTTSISKTIQQMPWTGEFVAGVRNGGGADQLKIAPNDPSIASIQQVSRDAATNTRWFQLNARRVGNVMVEARAANGAVLDYFQLAIKEVPRLPGASGPLEFELEADDPSKPGQINFKTYSPLNEADYVDNRLEAVGYGIYLFGCHVYCTNMPMPIFVPDAHIDFTIGTATPVDTNIYPDRAAAMAAVVAAAPAADGHYRYAFYRGAGGAVIAPTVFSPATTPRLIQTLLTARALLADAVQQELSVLALTMVGGFIIKSIVTWRVRVGQAKAERPPSQPPPLRVDPALQRLQNTAQNLQGKVVTRSAEVLKTPQTYRHTITADVPPVSYARIEREGALRLSSGAKAHYGEGVYAWPKGQTGVGTYIDIEVPAGTAVETLNVGGKTWVRMVPPSGQTVPVRIVGTNMPTPQIEMGRKLLGP